MKKQTEKLANDLISNIQAAAIKTAQNQTSSTVNYFIGTVANIDETNNRALVKYMVTQQDGSSGYSNIEAAVKTEEIIKVGDTVIVFYLGNLTDSFIFGKMTSTYYSKVEESSDEGVENLQSKLEKGQVVVGKSLESSKTSADSLGNTITDYYQPKRTSVELIPEGTAIPAGVDLNTLDYIRVGKYYCNTNAKVESLSNCPVSEAFMMEVYSPLASTYDDEETRAWVYRLRKITTFTGKVYYQYVISGNIPGDFSYYSWQSNLRVANSSITENGYITYEGGFTIQWGSTFSTGAKTTSITFPLTFTTLLSTVATYENTTNDYTKEWNIRNISNSGFSAVRNTTESVKSGFRWIALGVIK